VGFKQVPLVILIWSLFKYVKHTAPYFDSGSIFSKLYQEVMGRSKLYSVDYVGAHRIISAYKNAQN